MYTQVSHVVSIVVLALRLNAAALVTTHRGLPHETASRLVDDYWSDLQWASRAGHAECVRVLLSAGAGLGIDDCNPLGLTALECAISCSQRHIYPMLLAAGATIPSNADDINNDESGDTAYLRKVAAAGGFPAYEKAHRQVLATKFAAKAFPRLPTDVAAHFVAFAFHVGYY